MRNPNEIMINDVSLSTILELHKKWLNDEDGGVKANLSYADLSYADLSYADLSYADLREVDLSYADLREVDLSYADLSYADLSYADLREADLREVNLDFSQLNLSCRGLNFKIDEQIAKQLAYHLINLMQYSEIDTNKWFKKVIWKDLESSHLVIEHGMPILKNKDE